MTAPSANAASSDSGTQYCQSGYTPRADARANGDLYLRGPGDKYYSFFYTPGTAYQTRTNVGTGNGGFWRAYIGDHGTIDTAGTFGRCLFGS